MFDPLRLSGNRLQDEGTIAVCDTLRESKVSNIQELDLSVNGIGPTGAESVAAYVAVNGGLTQLDVSHNYLDSGGDGVRLLREAV